MNTQTPGQQAYEAFAEAFPAESWGPWDSFNVSDEGGHDGWEAVARAVETQQLRLAREDRDQLRTAVLGLAAELENEAARTYSAALRLRDDPAGLVLEEQAEAKRSTAIHLRKTAEPPA